MPPPKPPKNLQTKDPLLSAMDGIWYMVARKEYRDEPVYYGTRKDTRFSSPSAKYGVSYLARTKEAAFAETVRDSKLHYDTDDNLCIYASEIEPLELHTFKLKKGKARAIDLRGQGCARISARVECFTLGTARGYKISQEWVRALMAHPANAAGILYIGNRSADDCLALFGGKAKAGFDHSSGKVQEVATGRKIIPLNRDGAFDRWLRAVGIKLTPSISVM